MSANKANVRGYAVASAASYLPELLGEAQAKQVVENFSPGARQVVTAVKPVEWVPVSYIGEVTRAVAAHAKGDEARARETLIACGRYMAHEASNTFLRLFLRMVPPDLFSKKVPDLWNRDFTVGKIIVEESEKSRVLYRLAEMDDAFEHYPCTISGFVTFGLQTIGKTVESINITGWSLTTPCPATAKMEVIWSG